MSTQYWNTRKRLGKVHRIILYIAVAACCFVLLSKFGYTGKTSNVGVRDRTEFGSRISPKSVIRRHNLNKLKSTPNAAKNKERVLLISPMVRFEPAYWQNLLSLKYPRDLIDVVFILPRDNDGRDTEDKLRKAVADIQMNPPQTRFGKVTILREDFQNRVAQDEKSRHKFEAQKERRSAMARARNSALFTNLKPDVSWVLWLDTDIVETPATLIEDLTAHNKSIIAPNVHQKYRENGKILSRPYDFNNWIDSQEAQNLAATLGDDEILLEGYAELPTYRTLMAHLYDPAQDPKIEIELDGVGGAVLLVKAEVHRDGAMFPTFPFYHLIETEGFAKMAKRLNYQPYGLPHYLVFHINE
ncbi:glycosyltransferase family 62 protein [Tortispora caseinolytica NRRL Y-17796]|uniref:Glycosyltransferase family 62 protein n=1 Tax=Tortispora caseinolytica NRRL Y-17796 TaxID=767744 RepID=A0A1E4TAE3_9ASCO|nr:glycosyltransferase family 62 protein [Tortispora caseinolytica NRRL Y-17796]